jgi:ADP-ribose pyrophosphatase YjhB (NUDIX family)
MHLHRLAYRFCPCCGGRLEARLLKAGEPERLVCTSCQQVLYLDPKVAVGTIIRAADDRIVLVQRAIEPGYGRWVFPGGYVDRGEPLEVAALREAREECNVEIRIDGLVNLYSYPGRTPIVIVYAATYLSGSLAPDDEGLEARWFSREEVPWETLAFPSTHQALTDYFAGRIYPLQGGTLSSW